MNKKNYFKGLKQMALFRTIDEAQWKTLKELHSIPIKSYEKNCVIHFQNEYCQGMEIILSGSVTIQHLDEAGNAMTISDFYTGDILGANLLFSSNPVYPMIVVSKTPCEILVLNKQLTLLLCQGNADFLSQFLKTISDKTLVLTGKINTMAMKTMRQSIIEFLRIEKELQNNDRIILPFSKKEWAERLGVQRPSLSRELNKMREEGLIDFDHKTITLY